MNCQICGRGLTEGPSINEHHLMPKSKGGKHSDKILIHKVCHNKIHSVWSEHELSAYYHTVERILENEHMIKFVKWISNKPVDFYTKTKDSKERKRKRNR